MKTLIIGKGDIPRQWIYGFLFLSIILLLLIACAAPRIHRITVEPSEFNIANASDDFPYIKLHIQNGQAYSLNSWKFNKNEEIITGVGDLLDINRNLIESDTFAVPFDEIVLVETNRIDASSPLTALYIMTGLTVAGAVYCITNPKACFGSCPTFYVYDGNDFILQAEGFSSSIVPSLEDRDVDAISKVKPSSSDLLVKVTNEAFETHVIRSVNILALPHRTGTRVFSTPEGEFWEADNIQQPIICESPEGDCTYELLTFDGIERYSTADSFNLANTETLELTFDNSPKGRKGLIVSFRQSLLTTFLFYQSLAYMGNNAGYWLSQMERLNNNMQEKIKFVGSLLGGIQIQIQSDNGEWKTVGEISETGPIATDIKLIPLPEHLSDNPLKVRLKLVKGLWRIDHVALSHIVSTIEPLRIEPTKVFSRGNEDKKTLDQLIDPNKTLVTLPGDEYQIYYKLPDNYNEYELFIESQGYYLEWMRNEWLVDENPFRVKQMLFNPNQYLKDLAPQFKEIEAEMEETFWSSRYVIP